MTTPQTLWQVFNSRRLRYSALLLISGLAGLLLMAWILRVPLGVSIAVAVFIGSAGFGGAVLEMVVKAVAHSRAPMVFRPREPYEVIRYSKGWINIAGFTDATWSKNSEGCTLRIYYGNIDTGTILHGEDAEQIAAFLNEIATPAWAFKINEPAQPSSSKEPTEKPEFPYGEFDNGKHWQGEA